MPRFQTPGISAGMDERPFDTARAEGAPLLRVNMHTDPAGLRKRDGSLVLNTISNYMGGLFHVPLRPAKAADYVVVPYAHDAATIKFKVARVGEENPSNWATAAATAGNAYLPVNDAYRPWHGIIIPIYASNTIAGVTYSGRANALYMTNGNQIAGFTWYPESAKVYSEGWLMSIITTALPTSTANETLYMKAPPRADCLGWFNNQLIYAGLDESGSQNRLFYSDQFYPQSVKFLGYSVLPTSHGDRIRAVCVLGQFVYIFTDFGIYRQGGVGAHSGVASSGAAVVNYRDPDHLQTSRGASGPYCAIEIDGDIYCMDAKGPYIWGGANRVEDIGAPIKRLWADNVDPTRLVNGRVVYNGKYDHVWFCTGQHVFCFDRDNGRWSFYEDLAVRYATPVADNQAADFYGVIGDDIVAFNRPGADKMKWNLSTYRQTQATPISCAWQSGVMRLSNDTDDKIITSVTVRHSAESWQTGYVSVLEENETSPEMSLGADYTKRFLDTSSDQQYHIPPLNHMVRAKTLVGAAYTDVTDSVGFARGKSTYLNLASFATASRLYVAFSGAVRGVFFEVRPPVATYRQTAAAAMTVRYYDGLQWRSLTVTDNTPGTGAHTGKSLYWSNTVRWDLPERWGKVSVDGDEDYWLEFYWNATLSSACQIASVGPIGWCAPFDMAERATNQAIDNDAAVSGVAGPDIYANDTTNYPFIDNAIIGTPAAVKVSRVWIPPVRAGACSVRVDARSCGPLAISGLDVGYENVGRGRR